MAEKVLASALNGDEVVKAILDKVEQRLRNDNYLNPNSAYDWFTVDINLKVTLHDSGQAIPIEAQLTVEHGSADADHEVVPVDVEVRMDAAPPNQVRVESGQGVPVLAKDENGRNVQQSVTYSRKAAKKAASR